MALSPQLVAEAVRVGRELGIDPADLITVIGYETGGTYDPWQRGPTTKWGTHRGLIQWGEPQARQYGVSQDTPLSQQMDAVGQYLRDNGVRAGTGLLDLYSAINAGEVGLYGASDRPGHTVRSHVRTMEETYLPGARAAVSAQTLEEYPHSSAGLGARTLEEYRQPEGWTSPGAQTMGMPATPQTPRDRLMAFGQQVAGDAGKAFGMPAASVGAAPGGAVPSGTLPAMPVVESKPAPMVAETPPPPELRGLEVPAPMGGVGWGDWVWKDGRLQRVPKDRRVAMAQALGG